MGKIKIGLIREGKFPPDSRVALSPQQCVDLLRDYPNLDLVIQPSHGRCFKDSEYTALGLVLQENMQDCDILFGIKEVPVESLIPNKTYLFFSHTIKKQAYNRKLLQALLRHNIRMIDYETLVDEDGQRVIAFGRWAGIVGAHNALWTWSKRNDDFNIVRAKDLHDFKELSEYYKTLQLPPLRLLVTGSGRVAKGSMEVMHLLGIRAVGPTEFLGNRFDEAIVCNLDSHDMFSRQSDKGFDKSEFHSTPEIYQSNMLPYLEKCDILINGIYWNPASPRLFEKAEMHRPDFTIQVIADISCDVDGSIPATIRTTTISEPVFGYNKYTDEATAPFENDTIDIMAVDNLPNELPRDASSEFGHTIRTTIMPELLRPDSQMIQRASICKEGQLTEKYRYLSDYAGLT